MVSCTWSWGPSSCVSYYECEQQQPQKRAIRRAEELKEETEFTLLGIHR